jgi:hypothetical protein
MTMQVLSTSGLSLKCGFRRFSGAGGRFARESLQPPTSPYRTIT